MSERTIYRQTEWGFEIWRGGRQVGAGVGRSIAEEIGRDLTKAEARLLRKRGVMARAA